MAANNAEALALLSKFTYYGRMLIAINTMLEMTANMSRADNKSEELPEGFTETKNLGATRAESL